MDAEKIKSKLSCPQKAAMKGEAPFKHIGAQVKDEVRWALLLPPEHWKTRSALQARGLITGRLHNHNNYGYEQVLLTPLGEQVKALLSRTNEAE